VVQNEEDNDNDFEIELRRKIREAEEDFRNQHQL